MMIFAKPEGEKTIEITDDQPRVIVLRDFDTGSRKFSLVIKLQSPHAQCRVVGRVNTQGSDEKIWRVRHEFNNDKQVGTIDLRGVAEEESTLNLAGEGVLEPSSTAGTVEITEKVLLLDEARAQALPVLTVRTDQVEAASHGATVAPVDTETQVYFASRGIAPSQTQSIIKAGFLRFPNDITLDD